MIRSLLLIPLLTLAFVTHAQAQGQNDLPTPFDMVMLADADYNLTITHTDPASGAVINLTGYSFYAQFRSAPAPSGAVYATYSTPIVNASLGRSRVSLSCAQTLANSGKSGIWDLLMVSNTGVSTYVLAGKAKVMPTATRRP